MISDQVIVNVRGNIDNNTEKMLRLCNEKLNGIKLQNFIKPAMMLVSNQNSSSQIQDS